MGKMKICIFLHREENNSSLCAVLQNRPQSHSLYEILTKIVNVLRYTLIIPLFAAELHFHPSIPL